MSIQRWENWIHLNELILRMSDPEVDNPDWEESQDFHKPLAELDYDDERKINWSDPAVSHFMGMLFGHNPLNEPPACLKAVMARFDEYVMSEYSQPGMHGYDATNLEKLMAFREVPAGWDELDRLITQLSGRTFSALVERNKDKFLTHPEDQGLGGKICFIVSLEMEMNDAMAGFEYDDIKTPSIGVASDPRYIVTLIDKVIQKEAATKPPEFDYEKPIAVKVRKNKKALFDLPLNTTMCDELPDGGVVVDQQGRTCYSVIDQQWRELLWRDDDLRLMKVITDSAPAVTKRFIKGSFLSGEMGL
jgi:hypothetical protein